MPDFSVRRIREDDWEQFRRLRLDALRTDPLAFGSTLARESTYLEGKWRSWCKDGTIGEQTATFVATGPSGELVGMVGAFTAEDTPHVWGMWTRPEWRLRGIGRRLMECLLDWTERSSAGRPVLLDVNPSQAAAVSIYLGLGFRFSGVEGALGHDSPAVVRQMVRQPGSKAGGRRGEGVLS